MTKEEIISKFKDVPIGKDNLNRNVFANRILDESGLKHFLYNMYGPGDESITKEGLEFLKEYYGLDKIAEMILAEKEKGVDYHFENKEAIIDWLSKFGYL
jgi:hypothetical protein